MKGTWDNQKMIEMWFHEDELLNIELFIIFII